MKRLAALLMTVVIMLSLPVLGHATPKTATVEGFSITYNAFFKTSYRINTYLNAYKNSGALPEMIITSINVSAYDSNGFSIGTTRASTITHLTNGIEVTIHFLSTIEMSEAYCYFTFLGENLTPFHI